jgi:hypothetical protein
MALSSDTTNVILAVIALVASIITAALSAIFSRKNDVRLKQIEHELNVKKAEQDARRDYEYEAKKRLYQECEPILFQYAELSDSAVKRIYALARNAREGNLGPDRYWLASDHYFIRSTIYRLLAPLSAFKLLQRRLTGIDLKLDQSINIQYLLAKNLYYTFSSANELARTAPSIPYDPDQIGVGLNNLNEEQKKANLKDNPEKFWLQGLKVGALDKLVESLIFNERDSISRVMSFGEFEETYFDGVNEKGSNKARFETFITLFSYFHPKARPVLWRILVTQSFLYNAIKNIRNMDKINLSQLTDVTNLFNIEEARINCEWRQHGENVSNTEFEIPFRVAEKYLEQQLRVLFETKS